MLRPEIDRQYAVVLLIVALTVVGMGVVFKARKPERPPPPSETELARLQRLTQERRLRDLSAYLSESADSASEWLVSLGPQRQTGLVWGTEGRVIAPASSSRSEYDAIILPGGRRAKATSVLVPAGVPFSVLRSSELLSADPPRPASPPEPGEWVLAVARSTGGTIIFAEGLYQATVHEHCGSFSYEALQSSPPLSRAFIGGGVFTTEGALLGFIAECDGHAIAISNTTISDVLRKPLSENDWLEQEFGFRVDTSPQTPKPGAVVTAVWNSSLAGTAGIRPGDIIIRIGDARIQSAADLASLSREADANHVVQIRRGKWIVNVRLPAARPQVTTSGPSPQGITLGTSRSGLVVVAAVAPNSKAAVAGVRAGDVILSVQGAAFQDRESVISYLDKLSRRPVLLRLERNGTRLQVLVSP